MHSPNDSKEVDWREWKVQDVKSLRHRSLRTTPPICLPGYAGHISSYDTLLPSVVNSDPAQFD